MTPETLHRIVENPDALDALTPREFEELVGMVLRSFGWQVNLTPQTRDGGYDILAIQTAAPGLEADWIIECKKYSQDRKVGVEILRELFGVRDYLAIANAAIVTTTTFSRDALAFANNRSAIKLVDRLRLVEWIKGAAVVHPSVSPPVQFYSIFISYSSKDEEFARLLHRRMREAGLRVWFAPEDLKGGDKLLDQLDRAVQLHDRLLLVLSEHSIQSEWVMTEIRRARDAERKEVRRKLYPIRLTDFSTLEKWKCPDSKSGQDLAEELRQYYIPDFSNWKNHDDFEKAFDRLLRDLKAEEMKPTGPRG